MEEIVDYLMNSLSRGDFQPSLIGGEGGVIAVENEGGGMFFITVTAA